MTRAASLIVGQAIALGLLLAFLVVPGNAVFLDVYGAKSLPYVYLLTAGLGACVSFGLTGLQTRFELFPLAIGTTVTLAFLIFACWAVLYLAGVEAASFAALILFALELQLGFVFIGAQAGRTFDMQMLKRVFSYIVAAFVVGFMAGGFAAAGYAALGGDPVHLLAASSATAIVMALLIAAAAKYVPEPVNNPGSSPNVPEQATPSWRALLRVPLVRAVFAYELLSALGPQLVEYLLYDRAAARYSGQQALASFMGGYTAVLNLVDLVVLVTVGGFLISRFGLRYGLAANPLLVTLLMAAAFIALLVSGADAFAFFVLVAIARIAALTTKDAAARTAVNATFKVLPLRLRLGAQVIVEGAGAPIALGLAAVLILALNSLAGSSVTYVSIAALLCCLVWLGSAWAVFKRYREAVVAAARHRNLDGPTVDLNEPATFEALRALCLSGNPSDVHIGTLLVEKADPGECQRLLRQIVSTGSIDVQKAVIDISKRRDPDLARTIAENCVRSGDRDSVLLGLRTMAALPNTDPSIFQPFLSHTDTRLRAGAIGAALRAGHDPQLSSVIEAASSSSSDERKFAALVVAEAMWTPTPDLIVRLLGNSDPEVRNQAAAAVSTLNDAQRGELLSTAMRRQERSRFLRACRYQPTPAFCEMVARQLTQDETNVVDLVRILTSAGWRAEGQARAAVATLMMREIDRIEKAREWRAAAAAGDTPDAAALLRVKQALRQELIDAGRRLIQLLGLLYDPQLMVRVGRILNGTTAGDASLALESLDVALEPGHRGQIVRALKVAFAPGDVVSKRRAPKPEFDEWMTRSASDCAWAVHSDWLLASMLALMRAAGLPRGDIRPLGPISAELIPS